MLRSSARLRSWGGGTGGRALPSKDWRRTALFAISQCHALSPSRDSHHTHNSTLRGVFLRSCLGAPMRKASADCDQHNAAALSISETHLLDGI